VVQGTVGNGEEDTSTMKNHFLGGGRGVRAIVVWRGVLEVRAARPEKSRILGKVSILA
jgi:hypothetical protein